MSSNNTEELVTPTEYLEMDPIDLAQDEVGIQAIMAYLRSTRVNIKAAEKAGKRITAKAARTKPKQFDQDPLAMILKDA
jgi:hypothetical protein|tara:strand:+ start:906 stop:1142 length:237 start_codon:yes stop_codon:yes gene_type:complete